jgi:hypothetical protein
MEKLVRSTSLCDNTSSWFWDIIAEVREDDDFLRKKLNPMSRDEIAEFYREFTEASTELQCPPYTDSLQGKSEDTIADIAEYVVSKGKDYYSAILDHPDRIPTAVPPNSPSFKGTALTVFWERFGESIPR